MIQEEFESLAFEFARMASRYKEVAQIILFGSVAKGDADRRSDVDILVILDAVRVDSSAKAEITSLALSLEKKYDRNIQLILSSEKFEGLDEHFVNEVLHKGIVLYSRHSKIEADSLELKPFRLIVYNLINFDAREKKRIRKILYGHRTEKRVDDKIYRSSTIGIVQEQGGIRIGRGVFVIPEHQAESCLKKLDRLMINHREMDLWLSGEDLNRMKGFIGGSRDD